jgi:hypothetical protein
MGELGGGTRGFSTKGFRVVEDDDEGAGAPSYEPYPLIRLADIEPNLDNADLVKGVMAREAIVVMYGSSGSSKSFTATEIGLAVASGTPWRGHRTQGGLVLYVAAEGARGMRNRLVAAREQMALGPVERIEFMLVPSTVRLDEEGADVDRFVRTVRDAAGGRAALVIIDTLSQSMTGKDENAPKDMTSAVSAAQRIRDELGCTVLIVHHCGKNAALGARGHTSLRAATDTELEVTQDESGLCRIRATKQKEGITGAEWFHRLEQVVLGEDEDGDPVTTAVVQPLDRTEAAQAKVAASSSGGRRDRLASATVAAMMDLHRNGQAVTVPRQILADSGYLAFVAEKGAEKGWDVSTPVKGFRRADVVRMLADRFNGPADDCGRSADENGTLSAAAKRKADDARRKSATRRIERAIEREVIASHGDYVWFREPLADE